MDSKELRLIKEAYASMYSQIIAESECEEEEESEEKETPKMNGKKKEKKEKGEKEEVAEAKKIATGTGKKVMPSKKERSALAKKARAGEDIGKPGKGFEMVAKKAAKKYGSEEAGKRVAAAAMFKAQANEEVEIDLFDVILEHLVAEGYADTNKAALAIMANMSEEWRQSIVEMALTPEQEQRRRDLSKAINKAGTPGYPGVNSPETRKMQGEYIQLQQKLKGV